ncbi:MAG TPA: TetR/AcrR family transcriptional regulator [Sphingobium sp.]|nr:TetR/AcrR family transcriptional regulator [Sphingobium sp.]
MTQLNAPPALSRREARRRDRHDAIIDVAKRSFLENGYAATTMSGIAATLGGSKGTLWNYFPSKEELFAAVLSHATASYRADMAQILDSEGELEPTLRCFATEMLLKMTSAQSLALHRLVVAEGWRFPKMGAIFFELAPKNTRTLLSQFLRRAMDRGQLRREDPALAARTLITLILSGSYQHMLWGQITTTTPEQMEADTVHAIGCFLRAYAPDN